MVAEHEYQEEFQIARAFSADNESLAKTEVMLEQFCIWIRTANGRPKGYKSIMSYLLKVDGESTVKEALIDDSDAMLINDAWLQLHQKRPDESLTLALYYVYGWDTPTISKKCKVSKSTVSMLRRCGLSYLDSVLHEMLTVRTRINNNG